MKHHFFFINKLPTAILGLYIFLFISACQEVIDTPVLSCPDMRMTTFIQNNHASMNLVSNVIFRQHTDNGRMKYLSMETLSDTLKLFLNVVDSAENDSSLENDSLHLQTYLFSRAANKQGGMVVAASYNNGDYKFYVTDTSSITITKMNTKKKTISGTFYFAATDRTFIGKGVFENACYSSLP